MLWTLGISDIVQIEVSFVVELRAGLLDLECECSVILHQIRFGVEDDMGLPNLVVTPELPKWNRL